MAVQSRRSGDMFQVDFTFDPKQYDGEIIELAVAGEFLFYESNLTGDTDQTDMMDNEKKYGPAEYKPGLASIGGQYYQPMQLDTESQVYRTTLSLPAGNYNYHFLVNATLGEPETGRMAWSNVCTPDGQLHGVKFTFDQWLADPENKPDLPTPTGKQNSSTLYLGSSADFAWLPSTNPVEKGTVTFVSYADIDGVTRHLGVYLPADYKRFAAAPYKVIYVSHGGGGNENDWFAQGGIHHIMDNLIAGQRTREAVIVTMNNGLYPDPVSNWDFPKIAGNLQQCILPFVEKVFNVSSKPEDRAFCGLSMGGMTTSYIYMHHASLFGYFGVFSGAVAGGPHFTLASPDLAGTTLMVGCGEEDMAYNDTDIGLIKFQKELRAAGISYTPHFVTGAHDWFAWPRLFTRFAEAILWH